MLIELLPILLFFVAHKLYGIYVATGVLMAATGLQTAYLYATEKKLSPMHQVSFWLVMVFGSLTLVLQDETFIKWKPTILYTSMALALIVAQYGFKKNILQIFLGKTIELPNPVWSRLVVTWIIYKLFMAALNAFVVLNYTTDEWVNFKLWGLVFPLAFLIGQGVYIAPYIKQKIA